MAQGSGFSAGDMALRMALGVALVLVTWNPAGRSYVDWLIGHDPGERPYLALAGVLLLILWIVYLGSAIRSIGLLGMALAAALIGATVWVLIDLGVLSLSGEGALQWVVLVALGLVMGIGLSWSHVRKRVSGQVDVDDVTE